MTCTSRSHYAGAEADRRTFFGHPPGLFLLFLLEMWERFSFYGMRALLLLYLVAQVAGENPGRGWSNEDASPLVGWYLGMCYLLPILGGFVADRLLGAHRSVVLGGTLIALGHVLLGLSGVGALATDDLGMSVFVMGLALIVLGTGHFKPNIAVMVDKLYPPGDRRRDGAFTIFYMGINSGAFIGPLVCGFLGEKVGWHWGFGAAAVGMILGIAAYVIARPRLLPGIGLPPSGRSDFAPWAGLCSLAIATGFALLFHFDVLAGLGEAFDRLVALAPAQIVAGLAITLIALAAWFVASQLPEDRGPTACILVFVLCNAVFWLAFEQGATSLSLFARDMTNRQIGGWEMPASWFQSEGALLIIVLAPLFAGLWSAMARRDRNPSQPIKLVLALLMVGGGYVFMVFGSLGTSPIQQVGVFWLAATYFMHTLGELCMSPTGLSFVTRVAPVRSISLLMGIWLLSNAVANKVGGQIAGKLDKIASGEIALPWYGWIKLGGQADFFLLFVILSFGAALAVLLLTPLLKRLLHGRA